MRTYEVAGFAVGFDWNVNNPGERGVYRPTESEQAGFESVALDEIKRQISHRMNAEDLELLAGDAENAMREHALKQYPEDEDWSDKVQAVDCTVLITTN